MIHGISQGYDAFQNPEILWKSGKGFGKKPFGVRVSALLTVGGTLVEVIHQDIETQGGKKY